MTIVALALVLAQTEPESAIRALRAKEAAAGPSAAVAKSLAHQYYLARQLKLFELKMRQAAALDPRDADPPYFLGRFFLTEREDKVQAIAWLEKARVIKPNDPRMLTALGDAREKDGDLEIAERTYRQALRIDPNTPAAWTGLARCALTKGDAHAAEQGARKALPHGEAWWVLGQALIAKEQWTVASEALERAAVRLPHEPAILFQHARALRKAGNDRAADALLERWRELSELLGRPVDQRQK